MNGGGKPGLRWDDTGEFLIGESGTQVELMLGSTNGLARIVVAQYANRPVVTNDNVISFTVAPGANILVLNVVSPDLEDEVQLLRLQGATVSVSFKPGVVSFTVYGT